jgi:hypothetical protein
MRNIKDAVSWQIPAVEILQTKGVKLQTERRWYRYSPVVI